MYRRTAGDVYCRVGRVSYSTSGSVVMAELGVREMCVAIFDKNVAIHGHTWGGEGRSMELKEGWEMVVYVLQFKL